MILKTRVKHLLTEVLYSLLTPFGPGFSNRLFSPWLLFKHVIIQKVLRINSHVPWPVHWTSQIKSPENIEHGTRCPGLALGCYFDGRNGIKIGKNVWIGPKVNLISMNHDVLDYHKSIEDGPIIIGDNCWLATVCTILSGVQLGNHVVVAAGAVVTKSFAEDDVLLAGIPAKIIKRLPPYGDKIQPRSADN